jgi:TPR repeat protein
MKTVALVLLGLLSASSSFAGAKSPQGIPSSEELRDVEAYLETKARKLLSKPHANLHPEIESITTFYKNALPSHYKVGDLSSQKALSKLYIKGKIVHEDSVIQVPQNIPESAFWSTLCAAKGDAECQRRLGYLYTHPESGLRHNSRRKVCLYYLAINQGDFSHGANNLGYCYAKGEGGLEKNAQMAAHFYSLAAHAGNSSGQYNLSKYFRDGRGISKNPEKELEYLEQATKQGHVKAQAAFAEKKPGFKFKPNTEVLETDVQPWARKELEVFQGENAL